MAISENKTRIQMSLPKDLVAEIDGICERAHISRSVWIEYTLAMAVDSYKGLQTNIAAAMVAQDKESA